MGIILGSGSFRGRFGDHFRVGDLFGVGIISGAVQIPEPRPTLQQELEWENGKMGMENGKVHLTH